MNGRDGTTTFLPLESRIDVSILLRGQVLTREQTKFIHKKIETGEIINTDMIEQKVEQEKQLDRINDVSRKINLYQILMVSNEEKIGPLMTQMEQWSILSNILNYLQHSRFSSINHTLDVKTVNKYKSKQRENSKN